MKAYVDLYALEEDERIATIGANVMAGQVIGVLLETDKIAPGKIARYLKKIGERFPEVRLLKQVRYQKNIDLLQFVKGPLQ